MAESVKVIDPNSGSGYDYTSLFDWEAAQQADIDTSNTIAVAKCRCTGGTADTTAVTIDGWTTSAADYIKIWTDTSETYRHSGKWETGNKYRFSVTSIGNYFYGIEILENNIFIEGLLLSMAEGSYTSNKLILCDGANSNIVISKCILKGGDGNISSGIEFPSSTGVGRVVVNCISYSFNKGFSVSGTTGNISWILNCTAYDCVYGFITAYNCAGIKNCIAASCTYGFGEDFLGGSSYNNASSDSYVPGSNGRTTQTFSFVGAADFHLQSTDAGALGFGLNLYNDANYPFQTDIDGQDRGGAAASWDIGADEYVSSAAIEQEGFRFRNDDGSESAATWKANQDVNITLAADTAFRLRCLLKATGNPDSINAQAEARVKPSGGAFGAWGKIN